MVRNRFIDRIVSLKKGKQTASEKLDFYSVNQVI